MRKFQQMLADIPPSASREWKVFVKTSEALNIKIDRRVGLSNLSETLAHLRALDMCVKPP